MKLLPSRAGKLGILQLNNPKALHALCDEIIASFKEILPQWTNDDSIQAILLKSNTQGSKRPAFCAGGDVKYIWELGMAGKLHIANKFFSDEFQVVHTIGTSSKPIISLWDGIVMGGGVGISIHGKYRVATERSLFAMPETAIGFFPDVGSMYWMPRILDTPVAKYVALTGLRIKPEDLVYSGIATHYVPFDKLPDLESTLVEATTSDTSVHQAVADVLDSFHVNVSIDDCHFVRHKEIIEKSFEGDSMEEIFATLASGEDDFSISTLKTLQRMSPTGLKVTLEGLKRGAATADLAEDLKMEYRMMTSSALPGRDLYEGVRALLVDKDNSPQWNPPTIESVTSGLVDEFFSPLEKELPVPAYQLAK